MRRVGCVTAILAGAMVLGACGSDRPAGGSDNLDRVAAQAFAQAKTECRVFGIGKLARTYGGDPSDPVSVAQAYAEIYQDAVQFDAQNGCLEALGAELPD